MCTILAASKRLKIKLIRGGFKWIQIMFNLDTNDQKCLRLFETNSIASIVRRVVWKWKVSRTKQLVGNWTFAYWNKYFSQKSQTIKSNQQMHSVRLLNHEWNSISFALWKNTVCEIEIVWAPQFQFKFIIKSMETCLSYTLLNVITSGDQLAINVILILIIFSRPISLQFLHWGKEEVALKMVNIVVSAKWLDIPLSNYLYSLLKLFMGPFRTAGRSMRPRKWSNSCPAKEKSCEYLIRSIG